ncbi:cyclic nucleotide-binding domain protein (macronuclear) [Tetrahymena thermophila SB210]|uniref:Cyclic nucleotide-binding domain protein n=1 Tax=Tetrahymena thermophila (strain SB210) TaxID=312017 RepID=Q22L26_TETTS|nr:cyclic nucleotide-binding domain protein [Tetrahymena thermophila SB210]EAR85991.2 cyclic nucleotide-binding domain protein [Tetrahymena thermophila SB210]|eukprot:XP_976586.2 cyclic nucleotide-binding domain protein [Tetrahymena thermophila SB210]
MIFLMNQKPCLGEEQDNVEEDEFAGNSLHFQDQSARSHNQIFENDQKGNKKVDFSFNQELLKSQLNIDNKLQLTLLTSIKEEEPIKDEPTNLAQKQQSSILDEQSQSLTPKLIDSYRTQQSGMNSNQIFQNLLKFQYEHIVDYENVEMKQKNLQKKQKIHNQTLSKQLWRYKFFKILLLVNKFLFNMKKSLVYTRPYMLQKQHTQALNDKAAFNIVQNRSLKKEYSTPTKRSNFVKKIHKMFLKFKKQMKCFYKPIVNCLLKFQYCVSTIKVFEPFHPLLIFWDFIIIIHIILNLMSIPYEISFSFTNSPYFNLSNYVIIISDFFIQLNTSFYYKGKTEIKQHHHNLEKYKKEDGRFQRITQRNKYTIAYLIKIKHLSRLSDKIREYFQIDDKYAQFTNLTLLLIQILYLMHVFACMWYKIGVYVDRDLQEKSWIQNFKVKETSEQVYYVNSIYFAIVTIITIGYGDITPIHYLEKLFIVFMAFLSCVNFGYALNQIGALIQEINQRKQQYRIQTANINKYMKEMQVTSSLQSQARKYLEYAFCENFSKNQTSVSVLENLSSNLKNLIKKEVHMRYLKEIPCLRQNFSTKFLERVSLLFKEKSYGSGETIIDQFELRQPTLQIVMKGKVSLEVKQKYSQTDNKFQKLKKYQYFGQYEFFTQNLQSLHSVNSIGISTLLYLELDDFLQLLDEFPDDKEVYYSLKDQLNLYQMYGVISQQCISCRTQGHLINRCRFISYQPNQLKVISKYVQEEDKLIKEIQRKQQKKHNTLQRLNENKQIVEEIQKNSSFDEESFLQDEYENTDNVQSSEQSRSRTISFVDQKQQRQSQAQVLVSQLSQNNKSQSQGQALASQQSINSSPIQKNDINRSIKNSDTDDKQLNSPRNTDSQLDISIDRKSTQQNDQILESCNNIISFNLKVLHPYAQNLQNRIKFIFHIITQKISK